MNIKCHPINMLFVSRNLRLHFSSQYLVARQGLDHTNYGAVPIKSAKRLRLDPDAADMANFPLSLKQLEDFETGQRKFANAVKEHTEGGELDLREPCLIG